MKYNLSIIFSLFALVSCAVEAPMQNDSSAATIIVSMPTGVESKVYLGNESEGKISQFWNSGDRIAVISGMGTDSQKMATFELVGKGGASSGEFRYLNGEVDFSGTVDVIYPASLCAENFAVPCIQEYVYGTYDPSAAYLAWHGEKGIPGNGITLSNKMSILCLKYTGTSAMHVSSIRIKVYSSEDEFVEYRVMSYEGVGLSDEPESFYVSLPEITTSTKVVFETVLTDHRMMSIVSESKTFLAGNMYRFPSVEFVADSPERETLAAEVYTPSTNNNSYYPIYVNRSSNVPVNSWVREKTRIVGNMIGFEPDITWYSQHTNRYGSRTDLPSQTATGRFYIKKVNDRFYMVDPDGYLHHHRGVASFRQGESSRNANAFKRKYGTMSDWINKSQTELSDLGFHGTGAFCTNTYDDIQQHNSIHPDKPLTLSPSFSMLSSFRQKYSISYLNGNSNTAICLVLDERWPAFCKEHLLTSLAPYLDDPNTIGFFSDNEIDFSSASVKLLSRVLESDKKDHPAYKLAKEMMGESDVVTAELNDKYAGHLAELYYKHIKQALLELSDGRPRLLYLGSRLHGKPKKMQGVVTAAGRWCDVISINYYSSWDVDLTTMVSDWESWAPDTPFMVTEFYTKALDNNLDNVSGAGYAVPTQIDRAYAYQHFTLGLLESKHCVGWDWFRYQDDDSDDTSDNCSNKGLFDNHYEAYPWLAQFARELNYNAYRLIDYFD